MKRKVKNVKIQELRNAPAFNIGYPNHSVKFIVLFLIGVTLFSMVVYLISQGYIIIKW